MERPLPVPSATGDFATTGPFPATSFVPGDILADKYEVEEVIGRGGMGVVFAARHMQLKERVAIKLLLPSATQTEEFRRRFMLEARVTAKFRSEHIARVTDVGILDNGSPYMIMEYLEGYDLRRELSLNGPLPVGVAVDYTLQACEGMAEAHSMGVIHRDLKPSNLFLTRRRDGSALIKVLDFGISKAILREDIESRDLTAANSLLGSPRYMSPEQLRDTSTVDERSDVWSLACILYEMLSGRPPFAEKTVAATCVRMLGNSPPAALTSKRPEVSEALQSAIFLGLERDPDRRYANVGAFAASLLEAQPDLLSDAVKLAAARIPNIVDAKGSAREASGAHQRPWDSSHDASGSHGSLSAGLDSTTPRSPLRNRINIGLGALALLLLGGVGWWAQAGSETPVASPTAMTTPVEPAASVDSLPMLQDAGAEVAADADVVEQGRDASSPDASADADKPKPRPPVWGAPRPRWNRPQVVETAAPPVPPKPKDILENRQ